MNSFASVSSHLFCKPQNDLTESLQSISFDSSFTSTQRGEFTVLYLLNSGTLTIIGQKTINFVIVGGGASGGSDSIGGTNREASGGGGGGQVLAGSFFNRGQKTYEVIIGNGGEARTSDGEMPGNNGYSTTFNSSEAKGGEAGAAKTTGGNSGNGASSTYGKGGDATVRETIGTTTNGCTVTIGGYNAVYGGGGGGGDSFVKTNGGTGGGGYGGTSGVAVATSGAVNTGGGGGGERSSTGNPSVHINTASGGSGIAIVYFLT